jgi:ribosomal protein S18 acetylase RimI-like enzyme
VAAARGVVTGAAMNDVVIRRARPADLPVLAALRWEFRTDGAAPVEERVTFEARFRKEVAAALADGSWLAWVAEVDGLVVGHVYAARIAKLPNPVDEAETHLYVSNLYVRPEHRGRGLARALLDAVLADDDEVDATILWARPGTAALYERYGFGASPELMERRP